MKLLFLILLILGIKSTQPVTDGIFIIKKPTKKNPCEQEIKMLIGSKKICTLMRPIVNGDSFEYATDILYSEEKKVNYVNLGLTSEGVKTLNQTIMMLPDAQFALVVDNNVICIFTIYERMEIRHISIGDDLATRDLEVVRDALKKFQN